MPNEKFDDQLSKKAKAMEHLWDELLSEVKSALNSDGKIRFDYTYIRNQDGHGRGHKGRIVDFCIYVYDDEKDCLVPLFLDVKNFGDYDVKGNAFTEKFLEKAEAVKSLGPMFFGGHYHLSDHMKMRLNESGLVLHIQAKNNLPIILDEVERELYKIALRCEFLAWLDISVPQLLHENITAYRIRIKDKNEIVLEDSKGFGLSINLNDIEQDSNYFVGPRLMDFFSWHEINGVITLLCPWNKTNFAPNSEKVGVVKAIDSERCLNTISWTTKHE